MTKRPALSDESFLAHLFSPKKNALPTGLRARPVAAAKGRSVARVNAYNKMPAVKQEVLKRSGLRDAFLKGQTTYTEAKKALRPKAVAKGVARPVRARIAAKPKKIDKARARAGYIAQAWAYQLRRAEKEYNPATVYAGSQFVEEADAESLTYAQIKERASDPDYVVTINGNTFNPYWYR